MSLLSWQQTQWQQLQHARQTQRLPHALLLTGIAGIGKNQFAHAFAQSLLCQQIDADRLACGQCHTCRLVKGSVHPNVFNLQPEKPGHAIKVDQIREVSEFIQQSSLQGEYRIVIISPANQMNTSAANALLKTLEEPPAGALLILVADQSQALPATILSRCQRFVFPLPARSQALAWLRQAKPELAEAQAELVLKLNQGAPLAALTYLQEDKFSKRSAFLQEWFVLNAKTNPLPIAAKWQEWEVLVLLDMLLIFISDLMKLQLDHADLVNTDFKENFVKLKQSVTLNQAAAFFDYIKQVRNQAAIGLNFNKQLLIENILLRWMECLHAS